MTKSAWVFGVVDGSICGALAFGGGTLISMASGEVDQLNVPGWLLPPYMAAFGSMLGIVSSLVGLRLATRTSRMGVQFVLLAAGSLAPVAVIVSAMFFPVLAVTWDWAIAFSTASRPVAWLLAMAGLVICTSSLWLWLSQARPHQEVRPPQQDDID